MPKLAEGDIVKFKSWGETVEGTVVRVRDNRDGRGKDMIIYSEGTCPEVTQVDGLPTTSRIFKRTGKTEDVAAPLQRYKDHLMTYPAWQEAFANGETLDFSFSDERDS